MNDLEIERRIADIEGVHYIETKYDKNNFLALVSENDYTGSAPEMIGKYNPLTDDGLCFRLMVKHGIRLGQASEGGNYFCTAMQIKDRESLPAYLNMINLTNNTSPNKAICLAIISAHKDV